MSRHAYPARLARQLCSAVFCLSQEIVFISCMRTFCISGFFPGPLNLCFSCSVSSPSSHLRCFRIFLAEGVCLRPFPLVSSLCSVLSGYNSYISLNKFSFLIELFLIRMYILTQISANHSSLFCNIATHFYKEKTF